MKRCPTCNRTFDEDWLAFCTDDGTTLIEDGPSSRSEPPPTMMAPPMPPSVAPSEQPTINLAPSSASSQPPSYNPPAYSPPQQMQSGWQPPPPPSYANQPQQGLAITSMILGLVSITIGWCCSLGLLTAPTAIIMGIISLVQIKNDPVRNTGKPFSIVGIVTGSLYLLFWIIIVIIYGFAIFMGSLGK